MAYGLLTNVAVARWNVRWRDTCDVEPRNVDTPIQFRSKEEADDAKAFFSGITPLGRIGRSEEMASAIYSSFRTQVVIGLGSIWW
jgi:hypothetical protein